MGPLKTKRRKIIRHHKGCYDVSRDLTLGWIYYLWDGAVGVIEYPMFPNKDRSQERCSCDICEHKYFEYRDLPRIAMPIDEFRPKFINQYAVDKA